MARNWWYWSFIDHLCTIRRPEIVKNLLVEIEAQIELLCDVAPEFFTMKSIREVRYVHLQRNDYDAIHSIIIREMAASS